MPFRLGEAGEHTGTGMAEPTRFLHLEVWKKTHRIALGIYRSTERCPARERFGPTAQMREAAVSVPADLAEGSARRRPGDTAHVHAIARSSAEELRYRLVLSTDLTYVAAGEAPRLDDAPDEVAAGFTA